MEENPIEDLNSIQSQTQKEDPTVKVVTIFLFLITFIFSLLCFDSLIDVIAHYFSFRRKYVIGFELHSSIAAISISSISLSAFYLWKKRFRERGFITYLWLLTGILCLSILIVVIGFELAFSWPWSLTKANPFLPSYAVFPPFRFYFDLLFILAAGLPLLILQVFIRKAKKS